LEGLGLEKVDIFYGHLEYFSAIWYKLWPFGIICGSWVYFSRFGMFGPRKSGNPGPLALESRETVFRPFPGLG
jgi:hypothetical protein